MFFHRHKKAAYLEIGSGFFYSSFFKESDKVNLPTLIVFTFD